jgi:hypothetical protein
MKPEVAAGEFEKTSVSWRNSKGSCERPKHFKLSLAWIPRRWSCYTGAPAKGIAARREQSSGVDGAHTLSGRSAMAARFDYHVSTLRVIR